MDKGAKDYSHHVIRLGVYSATHYWRGPGDPYTPRRRPWHSCVGCQWDNPSIRLWQRARTRCGACHCMTLCGTCN